MRRVVGLSILGGLLLAAAPATFGGWATVTLLEVPEYLEAGAPATLSFKIRLHGKTVVWDREPALILQDAGLLDRMFGGDRVEARRGTTEGVYEATLTPDAPGELRVAIDLDYGNLTADLQPFRVVEPGERAAPLSPQERGRQLFMGKGCASCHAKLDDDPYAFDRYFDFGPPLVGRTFPADYVRRKIANPAEERIEWRQGVVMPRLEIAPRDVEALVRFVSGTEVASASGGGS